MPGAGIDILMYHSISDGPGPTNIAPAIFAAQIEALAASGLPVISLDDLVRARAGGGALPGHSVIITFDDGFQDFADAAWPVLRRHGFSAINYLPTKYIGGNDSWEGPDHPRALMGWATIRRLAGEGACFGSHSVTHPRLTDRSNLDLETELSLSKKRIESETGTPVLHAAPPYGATNAQVREALSRHYVSAVGTELRRAGPADDMLNLPRIEMFYFKDLNRWRAFLAGRANGYLTLRRAARGLRRVARR